MSPGLQGVTFPTCHKFHYFYLLVLIIFSNNYSLTPWSRVLLEKQTGFQLVKEFPAFYGTRRFITAFTSARHLSQSMSPGPRLSL